MVVTPEDRAGSKRVKENPEPGLTLALFCPWSHTFFLHPQPSAVVLICRVTAWVESGWLAACPGDGWLFRHKWSLHPHHSPSLTQLGQSGFSLAGI